MSLLLPSLQALDVEAKVERDLDHHARLASLVNRRVIATTVWHSLLWLVVANCVGVLLAAMLLFPGINNFIAPLTYSGATYGAWMPVHLNLQLYGWCSLPLIAFLIKTYGADRHPAASWVRSVLCLWSVALAIGAVSWLRGHSSGKLFLDFTGFPRVLFPLAMLALWAVLLYAFLANRHNFPNRLLPVRLAKVTGLLLLIIIPFILYAAASPAIYPPINPDTGGPTGASQLESTLIIIAVLLLLPFGLVPRQRERPWQIKAATIVFIAETLLCLGLGRADVSHHRPVQWISLGSLLLWIPLIPAYYSVFAWHANTRIWRIAFLVWWSVLIPTGWMLFLPGVLDRFKFTDGLVGHSLLAMAGFVSSLLIFVMVQLLGDDGWIFNARWSFLLWHISVFFYVVIMFVAGWQEGANPAFSIMPGTLRNGIYALRLLLGVFILISSADWLSWASSLFRKPSAIALPEAA